jgi:hypothetical protein
MQLDSNPARHQMIIEKFGECKGILFDYGETLDSAGRRWSDRSYALYGEAGMEFPREEIKRVLHYAEDGCCAEPKATAPGHRALVGAHVRWQFDTLGDLGGRRSHARR